MKKVRVWDLWVRIFHLVIFVGFVAAFSIANFMDDDNPLYTVHMIIGAVVGVAVILRVIWAFVGSATARLSSFVLRPRALVDYFKGMFSRSSTYYPLRNPAASYAAIFMALLALGMVLSGLAITRFGHDAKEVHEVMAYAFLVVACLHILGVMIHVWRHKDRLALSMLDGRQDEVEGTVAVGSHRLAATAFALLLVLWAGALLKNYDRVTGALTLPILGVTLGEHEEPKAEPHEEHEEEEHDHD